MRSKIEPMKKQAKSIRKHNGWSYIEPSFEQKKNFPRGLSRALTQMHYLC